MQIILSLFPPHRSGGCWRRRAAGGGGLAAGWRLAAAETISCAKRVVAPFLLLPQNCRLFFFFLVCTHHHGSKAGGNNAINQPDCRGKGRGSSLSKEGRRGNSGSFPSGETYLIPPLRFFFLVHASSALRELTIRLSLLLLLLLLRYFFRRLRSWKQHPFWSRQIRTILRVTLVKKKEKTLSLRCLVPKFTKWLRKVFAKVVRLIKLAWLSSPPFCAFLVSTSC